MLPRGHRPHGDLFRTPSVGSVRRMFEHVQEVHHLFVFYEFQRRSMAIPSMTMLIIAKRNEPRREKTCFLHMRKQSPLLVLKDSSLLL